MKNLALTLPGNSGSPLPQPSELKPAFVSLASVFSPLLSIIFYIAAFLCFYYIVWGAFHYIVASGNKEELAKARNRITWALVGLFVIMVSYLIAKFASEIFPPGRGGLPF